MTDLLGDAAAWLSKQRESYLSRAVDYVRGENSVTVAAMIGRTVFDVGREYGITERVESRDYIITAASLVVGGDTILPSPGDTIRETVGSTVHVYEVMAPGSEPCWRYSDNYRIALRVHTKSIGTEAV